MNESQTVGGAGGEGAHTGGSGADHGAQGGVLGLHGNVGRIILLLVDQGGDGLNNGSLWGDGVSRYQLDLGTHNTVRNRCVAV